MHQEARGGGGAQKRYQCNKGISKKEVIRRWDKKRKMTERQRDKGVYFKEVGVLDGARWIRMEEEFE